MLRYTLLHLPFTCPPPHAPVHIWDLLVTACYTSPLRSFAVCYTLICLIPLRPLFTLIVAVRCDFPRFVDFVACSCLRFHHHVPGYTRSFPFDFVRCRCRISTHVCCSGTFCSYDVPTVVLGGGLPFRTTRTLRYVALRFTHRRYVDYRCCSFYVVCVCYVF